MIQIATASSKLRSAKDAAQAASLKALDKAGITQADLAIVFASTQYRRHYETLLQTIRETTQAKTIVGASGFGILTDEAEFEKQPAVGVLVMRSDEIECASFLATNLQESNLKAGDFVAKTLMEKFPAELLVLFPDSFSFQSHLFFDGFENAYGYVPMVGGAAGEEGRESKSYQFEGTQAVFDAVAGVGLTGNFRFETGITRSCQPFGEPFQITKSEGNMIYEMDGRPAYDILLESLTGLELDNPNEIFEHVFLGVPLKNYQTDFATSPYLIRNIMGVNAKKGMVACMSPVEEGEFVTFTVRDPVRARQDMTEMLLDLKSRLSPAQPFLGFYFNCCARGQTLYGKPDQDIAMIRQHFPGTPIVGFFTFGEIAPIDHVNHLHHHSGVLTLLAPKS